MRALALTGIRQAELVDWPEPTIEKDTDVLLKVEMVGICGSDVHYYDTGRIGSLVIEYPHIIGHECAATVKAVGDAVSRVKVGDRVVVDPAMHCGRCDQCKAGRYNTCRNIRFLGNPGESPGCMRERIVMPQESCFPVGDDFSFERAVLCEPLAIGLYAVKQAHLRPDSDVAILGSGPIGLSCLVFARHAGVRACYVTEKIQERIKVAEEAGATWVGNPDKQDVVKEILKRQPAGMDVVFECAGEQQALDQAVEVLKPGGTLMLIGIPRVERVSFVIDTLRRHEITIVNVRRQNKSTQQCIELVASGQVDPDFMITHRFSLEQGEQALQLVSDYRDGVVKALVEI